MAGCHRDTRRLRDLAPPLRVQLYRTDPVTDDAIAGCTLWLGPCPVRWRAIHSCVSALDGFREVQVLGPLRRWQHTHHYLAAGPALTVVTGAVAYALWPGRRGWLTRGLFSRAARSALVACRAWRLRRRGGLTAAAPLLQAGCDVTVLVIWGVEYTWVPLAAGERLHASLAASEMVTLAGSGHRPKEEQAPVNQALLDFLDRALR